MTKQSPISVKVKQGDKGRTSLLTDGKVSKSDLRIRTLGSLDELSSHLGVSRSLIKDKKIAKEIRELQADLSRFCAEVASETETSVPWLEPTSVKHVRRIDDRVEAIEKNVKLPRSFLIPGASAPSAAIDVARAVARRFESQLVELFEKGLYTNLNGLAYANHLSFYLFVLARAVEKGLGIKFDAKEVKR